MVRPAGLHGRVTLVVRTYRTLLAIPGAAAFFIAASIGRLGIAMTSLGIVWLVHAESGSFAVAGAAAGGFSVAEGLAGPQIARLIDRYGQTRILAPLVLAHGSAVGTLLFVVMAHAPTWSVVAGGVLMGSTIPQLGALSATRWSALSPGRHGDLLHSAFALESLANGSAYLVGPGVVSVTGASGHAVVGTALAAGLVVGGGLALSLQRGTAPPVERDTSRRRHEGGLLRPAFAVLFCLNVALGGFFGAVQLSVTAFGTEIGAPGLAAMLFVLSNVASLAVGWLYGVARWRTAAPVQLAVATAAFAAASVPLAFAGSPAVAAVGVAATGLMVPVILILSSTLTRAAVQPAVLTQAFTWTNSGSAAGYAGFAGLAGLVIDRAGAHGGFLLVVAVAASLAVVGGVGRRWLPGGTLEASGGSA